MRTLRLAPLAALLLVGGCQCFQPVSEGPDGGEPTLDAGAPDSGVRDAGLTDAGNANGECSSPADCTSAPWSSAWCGATSTDAGFSCIDHRCVSECFAAPQKTCAVSGDCLQCANEPDLCPLNTCPTDAFTASVTSVECRPGVTPLLRVNEQLSFVPIRDASCEMSVSGENRGLGQVTRSGGRHSWFIRELGGWCVGEELPTGLVRSQVACPLCTFVVVGF